MDDIFSGIPALGDTAGLETFMNDQTVAQAVPNNGIPAALQQQQPAPAAEPAPTTDPAPAATPAAPAAPTYTSEQVQEIINRMTAQQAAQAQAQQQAMLQQRQAQAAAQRAAYTPQQAAIIKQLIDKGVGLDRIMAAMNGGQNAQQNALAARLQAIEQRMQQQQYAAEEQAFINKMTEFGNKFGLTEADLVTFGNAAYEKGINVAQVTDLESVFRALYPEQYAIRMQRMSNAPASQIFGGSSVPEMPRAAASKVEDQYVEQFLRHSMPNQYGMTRK